jgi:hypothetical protein
MSTREAAHNIRQKKPRICAQIWRLEDTAFVLLKDKNKVTLARLLAIPFGRHIDFRHKLHSKPFFPKGCFPWPTGEKFTEFKTACGFHQNPGPFFIKPKRH